MTNNIKILHAAALLNPPSGIINQMHWEQYAANALGFKWKVKIFSPKGIKGKKYIFKESSQVKCQSVSGLKKIKSWYSFRKEYYEWLGEQEQYYDVFLLRYYVHDPFQYRFVSRCKKPVYFVHHTLEIPELSSESLFGRGRACLESILGGKTIRKAAGIIGVTQEICDYERYRAGQLNKKSIVYPNAIMLNYSPVEDKRHYTPNLLFVSSYFYSWHGLDLLLKSMEKNKDSFTLHLVGKLSKSDHEVASRDNRVVIHGHKNISEIRNIAADCWLGISSLALDRKNMQQACTLKVREYLAMGLPTYANYEEVFPEEFLFYIKGDCSIERILEAARKNRKYSRHMISELSGPYISKKSTVLKLYNDLISDLS
ncbi:glycosyltransferase [Zobellella endophytica]|uniref:glycosyltransferase n=1 Tax=Zobellella endophytica TaxID=2116700 RepID=UPI001304E579|nr:glycosyltransferase [Zobellella endophytica]